MPDDPLTTDAAPPTDEAAPHHVAVPEPEAAVAPAPESPTAEEAPAPPESAAPPEPPNPEPLTPSAYIEEEPDEEPATQPAAGQEPPPDEPPTAVEAEEPAVPEPSNKRWYVVKVQSGREESIKEAIERRVKIERLEEFFGQIVIPVERVTEMRRGKRVVKERKLYPGYLMAEVEYNDRILYLFRETSGVGDFVGGTLNRPPPPMSEREVAKMLGPKGGPEDKGKEIQAKPPVERGDRVKVRDGTFAGMEGEVKEILETLNHLKVELTIFGRPVP
ncbi:MAG TPA: transcription termination/antitermination NusG family protein, partial [Gemmataceae bacterium]|nr:transcription termination/antitermination NusG family protein [Gemmataceae bacterium]